MRTAWRIATVVGLLSGVMAFATAGAAQSAPSMLGLIELHFTPVRYAQIAIWLERADGTFVSTVRLTEAVALRGIGNRPGAAEMNSGFRWPYGRREGALPVWAARRASADGAQPFRRVIFQNRTSEGLASRTSNDFSLDNYYCLSFDRSRSTKDALDAVSCASVFNSDKGRFVTDADVAMGYGEPYEHPGTQKGEMRPLSLTSLYPPRRDITPCNKSGSSGCYEHPDAAQFAAHARDVMPEIDAVTMATPIGGAEQTILYTVPSEWAPGAYHACLEINVEGDYNDKFNASSYPTPMTPSNKWDSWAIGYGYPYRGQPSVVYCADIEIGGSAENTYTTDTAKGSAGTWEITDPSFGQMQPMTGMTDDPVHAPGSGGDRLQLMDDGYRLKVVVKPSLMCMEDQPPGAITGLKVTPYHYRLHAHEWAHLSFNAASDDHGIYRYDARVSTSPITDDASFMAATSAKQATIEAPELAVPTTAKPGTRIDVDFGGLVQQTHYYVAVRAIDGCNSPGPMQVTQFDTPKREFATVSPCFVATAAYGTPMADEVSVLRRFRDRHLQSNPLGRALVTAYYSIGPVLANQIRDSEPLRAAARTALGPAIAVARWLD